MVSLFQQDKRVMGVTCATNNARFYTLSEFTSNRGKGFKCKCEQLSPVFYKELNGKKQVSMQCHLHVWECPIWKPSLEQMMFKEKHNGGRPWPW